MKENNVTIKIPRQIRTKTEFFAGFGVEELIKTIIIIIITTIISYCTYLITNNTLISTMLVIAVGIITVFILIKGNNNFSMADIIKNIIKYKCMQKQYHYERGDKN